MLNNETASFDARRVYTDDEIDSHVFAAMSIASFDEVRSAETTGREDMEFGGLQDNDIANLAAMSIASSDGRRSAETMDREHLEFEEVPDTIIASFADIVRDNAMRDDDESTNLNWGSEDTHFSLDLDYDYIESLFLEYSDRPDTLDSLLLEYSSRINLSMTKYQTVTIHR